jgi:protein disulfide-isomerase
MKNWKLVVLTFAASLFVLGQGHAGEAWQTDFEAAQAEAAKTGKPMLLDFTGSDWCGWCIKLDKEVFSKKAFKDYAESELVLVEVDFPRGKKQSDALKAQNEALAEKYGIRGFPTIVLLSPEGKLIGKTGYRPGGAEAYVEHLKEALGKAI